MITWMLRAFVLVSLLFAPTAFADEQPGKDHPFFSPMKHFARVDYEKNFDAVEVPLAADKVEAVEGDKIRIIYVFQNEDGTRNPPSALQIVRNHENAVKKLGGEKLFETMTASDSRSASYRFEKDGKETFVVVNTNGPTEYELIVLVKGEMVQEVTSSDMRNELEAAGRIALYIGFDTGKATIKPEFQPILDQIVALMKESPNLKLAVEGHTDDQGQAAANKTLSEQRAKAVVKDVVGAGIDAKRLKAAGYGQEKPIADNATDEGRAKNRRVELVKL